MAATKITDLLPLSEEARAPHAYQVFGLQDGEQDGTEITEAVQATVARLKAAKSGTDAKLWGQAARLVQEARLTLADPEKKAQLDARFGIISIEDSLQSESKSSATDPLESLLPSVDPLAAVLPPADPLAAVLPPVDPLAAVLPPSNPMAPVPADDTDTQVPLPQSPTATHVNSMPPGVFGTPADQLAPSAPVQAAAFVVKPKRKRRKNSVLGMLIFFAFALGMFGLIGVLGYFLLYGSGELAITNANGQISISTQGTDQQGQPTISSGRSVPQRRQRADLDSVMGSLAGDVPVPVRPQEPSSLASELQDSIPTAEEMSPPPMAASPQEPDPKPDPEPKPDPKPVVNSEPMTDPPAMEPLTDEMIADAEKRLERVRTLIREANWKEMKVAAESALETPMTDQQTAEAEALFELADLATYYRVGIERAVADLNVGNDFAVTDTFRVIVVETGEDLLVVRYNEKNKSFRFDEFPFVLAHKLASFAVPASPSAQAAKAAYQAIAPKSTETDRDEATGWLHAITEQVDGADPKRVASAIETLFDA